MNGNCMKTRTPTVGDRIECSGYFGTIKYIGTVEGYAGNWLGIDWDDITRGKHDGFVQGTKYFTASSLQSGSFVRPEKVQLGQSAVIAITSRYGRHDDEFTTKINEQQLLTVQQNMKAPFLKLVGFDKITDKQSDFSNLKVVSLRLQNVYTSGQPKELKELCPNITELDLSKNLINNWSVIFDICSQLKNLEWLNVSENSIVFPIELSQNCTYCSVRTLICGSMKLTWNDILNLSKVFTNLEELRVPNNNITTLDIPEQHNLKELKILDLENNPIENWNEILKICAIETLEQMSLENIKLMEIRFSNASKVNEFANLKKLILTNNLIDEWESIGELNKLQTLDDLKLLNNPIFEKETFDTCKQLIVARIANLKYLNGSLIQADERRGSEYDYLKKYALEYWAIKDNDRRNEFLNNHTRYQELIKIHGMPEESELTVQSKLIKVSLIEVVLRYNDLKINKKLPPTILIQKLIMLVQRLFRLSERPTLLYISKVQPDIEIELDDTCKELGYYSVENGDEIIVKL